MANANAHTSFTAIYEMEGNAISTGAFSLPAINLNVVLYLMPSRLAWYLMHQRLTQQKIAKAQGKQQSVVIPKNNATADILTPFVLPNDSTVYVSVR